MTKGSSLDPARTRAAILAGATELFYTRGLDGVGVAELCAALGVSKETLYRHFGSKEGLIEAVLVERSERVTQWLADAASAAGDDPFAQLGAVFDALAEWHASPEFRGCAILNAATQHHSPHPHRPPRQADAPGRPAAEAPASAPREVAARHLDRRLALLTDIARRAGADAPEVLGRQLLMLVTGATIVADHHPHTPDAARLARSAALTLLQPPA